MYIKRDGTFQIVCDGCKNPISDVGVDYLIVDGIQHFCPACYEKYMRTEEYRRRLRRLKNIKEGKRGKSL